MYDVLPRCDSVERVMSSGGSSGSVGGWQIMTVLQGAWGVRPTAAGG
jgi:hypothetical protein